MRVKIVVNGKTVGADELGGITVKNETVTKVFRAATARGERE